MPGQAIGYVNLLVDWNQDGQWGGSVTCPGGTTPMSEHALVDFPVPNGFNGPLSALGPPSFVIGPKAGHVWARFSITERPVGMEWIGDGVFEDGESEDYLLARQDAGRGEVGATAQPDSAGLHAHDYAMSQDNTSRSRWPTTGCARAAR